MAWGAGEALVMEEVKVDPPQRLEVRLRILFTSICHTDLSAWKGEVLFIFSIISFLLLLLLIICLLFRTRLNKHTLESLVMRRQGKSYYISGGSHILFTPQYID